MTNEGINASINELVSKWQHLNDVQRGEKLLNLRGKTSLRALANRLPCSESHLRNLVCAGQALLADRILARERKITTRELVRRSKATAKARVAADKEALDRKRTKEAQKWCEVICEWLDAEGLLCSQGEVVVNEARRELFEAERAGKFPPQRPPNDMPVEEIILNSRPSPLEVNDVIGEIGWYDIWLTHWTYFAIADTVVRDRALGLAWHKQARGESPNVSKPRSN
jgi:hypothetical protein